MKQFFVRWLIAVMMMPGFAQAQAVPATAMQKTVSSLIQNKAIQRGFAANDPRIGATLQKAGSGIAGAAAAAAVVTLAGVTAPAWITAAVTVGLGTLFAVGIDLAIDGIKWLLNSDGSVKGPAADAAVKPLVVGGAYWHAYNFYNGYGSSPLAAMQGAMMEGWDGLLRCEIVEDGRGAYCYAADGYYADGSPAWQDLPSASYFPSGSPCASNTGSCRENIPSPMPAAQPVSYPNIDKAVQSLTPEQLAKPVNPQVVAAIADSAWQQAAQQPDYEGLPYDSANPITSADAAALQQSSPSTWPTVGDAVSPQVTPSGGTSPFALPQPSTSTPPTSGGETPTEPTSSIDWMLPAFSDQIGKQTVNTAFVPTVFAAPTGCPAPITFQMLGKTHTISYGPFCDLMATLAPLFLATGAAAAALIFAQSLKS